MRVRVLALTAAAAAVGFTIPSHAATARPQISDARGDGNAVNDQGLGLVPVPEQKTPYEYAGGDIVSVLFKTTFVKRGKRKVANGFTVTMKLADAPGPQTDYRIAASSPLCADDGELRFQYDTLASGATGGAQCFATTSTKLKRLAVKSVVVRGSSIVWTLPAGAVRKGTTFSSLAASTRLVFPGSPSPRSATVPAIDVATGHGYYTYGR